MTHERVFFCDTNDGAHLHFLASYRCYLPPYVRNRPSVTVSQRASSAEQLAMMVGLAALSCEPDTSGCTQGTTRYSYRSTRKAYSSILIRRMRSSFTLSKERRSPSSRAMRACSVPANSETRLEHKDAAYAPASPHARSPTRFGLAHIASTRSGESVGHWRA